MRLPPPPMDPLLQYRNSVGEKYPIDVNIEKECIEHL